MMRSRGFTLLEMLLAIGILLLIAATLASAIQVGFHTKMAAERAVEATRDTAAVGTLLVQDLATCLQPATASTDPNNTNFFLAGPFYGNNNYVEFYTTGLDPKATIQSDVRMVAYTLSADSSETGMALFRRVNPNILTDTAAADPSHPNMQQEVVVHGVVSMTLRYFDGQQWYDEWDSTQYNNLLPYAVAIRIELSPNVAGEPNRVIERYVPLWCAVPATTATQGAAP